MLYDVKELLCGPPPEHLSGDRTKRNAVLANAKQECRVFIIMAHTILSDKEKEEREVQIVTKSY